MKSYHYYIVMLILLNACNSSEKKTDQGNADSNTIKTTTLKPDEPKSNAQQPPIINIADTLSVKRIIVYMSDSAATYERIGLKLGQIYGVKLQEVLKKNKLQQTGAPMAWYKTQKAPYFFEAGIPVDKKPGNLPKDVFIRETGVDSILVAHFFGPYDLLSQGYTALKERLKDKGISSNGLPYEIYISDAYDKKGNPVDPYKVQTDIVFPKK